MSSTAVPAEPGGPRAPQYPIESVDNALRLLLLFGEEPRVRLKDASEYLGVASSTAHRLFAMLAYRGFVRQEAGTRAYVPGPAMSGIAFSILARLDVRGRARPILEQVLVEFDETVNFVRLEGRGVHFLDSLESTRAVRVGSRMGKTLPANATSTGKALLSLLEDDEIRALYADQDMVKVTPHSISDIESLLADIHQVRARGYAISDQESEELVSAVAVALPRLGPVCYAISVAAPINRITPERQAAIAAALTAASASLSEVLF